MRRTLAVLVLAGTALGLVAVAPAGAGGGGDIEPIITKAEVRRLREAAQRTIDAGPRRYTVEVGISTPADPPSPGQELLPFRAEGTIDPVTGATTATFEAAVTDTQPDTTIEVIAPNGHVSYLRSDAFELPPGKEWVEVPTAQLANASSSTSALKYASQFVGKPRVGSPYEARDGVETTRYVVDVPIRRIIEAGGVPTDPSIERQLRRLERTGRGNAFVNLYLDDDGRIVQYATFMDVPYKRSGDLQLSVSGEFYDFGTELDATPPPADQVVAADTVADQLEPLLGELQPATTASTATTAVAGFAAQTTPTPEERLRNAVDATVAAGTTGFVGMVALGQGSPLTFTGESTIDGRDADITIDFGSVLPTADPMRTLSVDGTYFLELQPLASAALTDLSDLPAGVRNKTWVRVEPDEVGQTGVGAQGSDPGAQLAMLRAITKVKEVGTEDVAGEPATHFSGVVDLERALQRAPKSDRARLRAAFESFGRQRVPVDVWLDATDRLRRFDATIEAPQLRTDAEVSAIYSDFGTPVDVERPAKREVVSYDDFLAAVRESVQSGGGI